MNIQQVETWFKQAQRNLPFRHQPNPYWIWVSEVMLQQTQMETVLQYYSRFLKRFPNIETLANASLEEVLNEVQGLGYYRRFRLLHQGAHYLQSTFQGKFPTTYEEVIKIPGVGSYTAGAIMAIAFNQPYAATDGNVIRVLSRYYGIRDDMALLKSRNKVNDLHQQLVEKSSPRIFVQAMMELGALICRPKQPICKQCPLRKDCIAYQNNLTTQLPLKSSKTKKKYFEYKTLILVQNNAVWLTKNKEELLKDFYLLPQWDGNEELMDQWLFQHHVFPRMTQSRGQFKHVFTHQVWSMNVFHCQSQKANLKNGVWQPISRLAEIPIPEAHRKILRQFFPNSVTTLYNKQGDK